ncbi:MAG TPA: GPW/gp25 family protein [Cytophagaceae bacterium]|jgi:phage baseplate assembly protein W|nr:GPW/gp25 family protein [Cytophagaceae bacterium]
MADKLSFLGTGWKFPPSFDEDGVAMAKDADDIKQSLHILFTTALGERVMLPSYGCDLSTYLFKPISNSKTFFIKNLIQTAIIKYEPRINLIEVYLDQSEYLEGKMKISLDYSIRLTNTRFNLVFPFYKSEGTLLPQLYFNNTTNNGE